MKKYIVAAICMGLLSVSSANAQDQIQSFVAPQTGVIQQPAVAPVYPGPVYPGPGVIQQPPIMSPPVGQPWYPGGTVYPTYPTYNPPVFQTGPQLQTIQYDQWGRPIINTQSTTVMNSATQPGRDQYVAGTLQWVDRYETDQFGRQVHVTGWSWVGAFDGQPHGNLNRRVINAGPGGTHVQDDIIMYSQQGGAPQQTPQPAGDGG